MNIIGYIKRADKDELIVETVEDRIIVRDSKNKKESLSLNVYEVQSLIKLLNQSCFNILK